MTSDGLDANMPGTALSYYAAWLGTNGPRIAAVYARAPLPVLVEAVLAELTAAGKSFTAYDVTLVLRAVFSDPRRILPHYDRHGVAGVQPEVHRQMAGYLADGNYTARVVHPNGVDPARLYTPATRRRRGGRSFSVAPASVIGSGNSPLPLRAWVIRDGAC